ncbi:MAG: phosphotriesterase-related protein [Chloroflexi bacterium]|nr:phosphotriesterase-related protein [Chloroflexota bacterium]
MATLNSVLGAVDTRDLGFTLCHEHVVVASAGVHHYFPETFNRRGIIEEGVRQLREAYGGGVRTIVEVTPPELGRDIRLLREVSQRSKVQIIAATGTYVDIPRFFWYASPDRLAALYVREIEVGMEGTEVKAGIIKVANDNALLEAKEVTVLRAAARASKRTGVPVTTHTNAAVRNGEAQVRIFEEEGMDLGRVCIGHSNDTTDMDYLLGLLRKGVYLGLDDYPGHVTPPDWEERTRVLTRLIDAGYAHRLMLAHDWGVKLPPDDSWGSTAEQQERANPDHYLFITRRVLPRLRQMGVPEAIIQAIMVENPRRFFESRS